MIQQDEPDDYVVATGEANSLEDFVSEAFAAFGLDWRKHVVIDQALYRPIDLPWSRGNPEKRREARLARKSEDAGSRSRNG